MTVCQINPTEDPRWAELVQRHPRASVFHTVGWLQALQETYCYDPVAFTTSSASGELTSGLVFCRVNSWLTGRRLVSLPFSDHCDPLCDSRDDLNLLLRHSQTARENEHSRYLELRPLDEGFSQTGIANGFQAAATYYVHVLDLDRKLDDVFRGLDRDSVQRRIRRSERAGLTEKCGSSEELLGAFYFLFVKTRGRHSLPPTPYTWFRNLIQFCGDRLEIRVAYQGENPIAAILTLRCKDVVCYKYGCSDAQFNRFGAMPWLLWRAIESAKRGGATKFDMGRTDEEAPGLLAFKNHWVPQPRRLVYWRFPENAAADSAHAWKSELTKRVFSLMPDRMRIVAGRVMYRHIA
jgi:hypothetical protein